MDPVEEMLAIKSRLSQRYESVQALGAELRRRERLHPKRMARIVPIALPLPPSKPLTARQRRELEVAEHPAIVELRAIKEQLSKEYAENPGAYADELRPLKAENKTPAKRTPRKPAAKVVAARHGVKG